MPHITVIDHASRATHRPDREPRQARLTGILATMGGLSLSINLLGADNIVNPGQWLEDVTVTCTREEADVIAEIVNEMLATQNSKDTGRIVFV